MRGMLQLLSFSGGEGCGPYFQCHSTETLQWAISIATHSRLFRWKRAVRKKGRGGEREKKEERLLSQLPHCWLLCQIPFQVGIKPGPFFLGPLNTGSPAADRRRGCHRLGRHPGRPPPIRPEVVRRLDGPSSGARVAEAQGVPPQKGWGRGDAGRPGSSQNWWDQ